MPTPEFEKKKFSEKIWNYAVWGTIGVVALVAAINFFNTQIPLLENSLHPIR